MAGERGQQWDKEAKGFEVGFTVRFSSVLTSWFMFLEAARLSSANSSSVGSDPS